MKRTSLMIAAAALPLMLSACGGGGGGGAVASIPPPPQTPTPTPTPTPAARFAPIPAATTSQQFAVSGSSHLAFGDGAPRLGAADQLQLRYVASTDTYEVELPQSQTWVGLSGMSEGEAASGNGARVTIPYQAFQYSAPIEWFTDNSLTGVEAVGIATPAGAVPVTGNATYTAYAYGRTSESNKPLVDPLVLGDMTLNFDFARGSLSGGLTFMLDPEWNEFGLGPFEFRETVYSTGSTTFSGKFDTDLPGVNSFSGLFTGPHAEELIGNFAIPYRSPINGQTYQADGAFVGKK
jgi:hypothetical protein